MTGLGWKCPDSKLILAADAPREEWLAARATGIGGSDAAALTGDSPYDDGTPWFVYQSKIDPTFGEENANRAMDRGRRMEPIVCELFEEETGLKTRRQGLHQSKANPVLLASVDRLTNDDGGLETKTSTTWTERTWPEDGSCPPLYERQADHYLMVTGRTHWWVAALIIDTWQLRTWCIERNEERLEYLATVEDEFWKTYVGPRVEPELDWDRITNSEIEARFPRVTEDVLDIDPDADEAGVLFELYQRREKLAAEKKTVTGEYERVQTQLKAFAAGYGEIRVGGHTVFTYR
ncbi:YqaJ viral recombinase family protein, partial [Corynebacterium sp.]|uniref:YqaJ viral recombinase family nuclease n=1 Tax=Corynebacterium sp. TaxID=1720 RepID=UPI002F40FC91